MTLTVAADGRHSQISGMPHPLILPRCKASRSAIWWADMDQESERTRRQRELQARISELAASLLQAIAGGGGLHELPRQIEDAARAIREHVDAGGSALGLMAQALNIEDAVAM